jgi:chromosome segregation ATPase
LVSQNADLQQSLVDARQELKDARQELKDVRRDLKDHNAVIWRMGDESLKKSVLFSAQTLRDLAGLQPPVFNEDEFRKLRYALVCAPFEQIDMAYDADEPGHTS